MPIVGGANIPINEMHNAQSESGTGILAPISPMKPRILARQHSDPSAGLGGGLGADSGMQGFIAAERRSNTKVDDKRQRVRWEEAEVHWLKKSMDIADKVHRNEMAYLEKMIKREEEAINQMS